MEPTKEKSVFEVLNAINCNEHTEKKNNLTYLSWAWAWTECKKNYPNANYTIYENEQGRPYFDDGRTAWVKTSVTIEGIEHIDFLPILDQSAHKSLPLNAITSWDMNKAIQRSLTKALARHGLGLYIYAGEDLPEGETPAPAEPAKKPTATKRKAAEPAQAPDPAPTDGASDDFYLVKQLLSECKTKDELVKLWNDWPELHEQIKPIFTARRKELGIEG